MVPSVLPVVPSVLPVVPSFLAVVSVYIMECTRIVKKCSCVKAGHLCISCLPLKKGNCSNLVTPPAVVSTDTANTVRTSAITEESTPAMTATIQTSTSVK